MWSRRSSVSKSISIQLLEPIIFIGSNLETSPVVRGTVNLSLEKSVMIQNLSIRFDGMMKTQWKKDSKFQNAEKNIASSHFKLFPNTTTEQTQHPLLLNSGSTIFSFEMPLPAGIPETVKCSQVNVDYTLTVNMDYKKTNTTTVLHHEQVSKTVILARLPDNGILNGENYPSTIDSHKHFSNWCQYRITIDKKSAALGSRLPVKIEIAPTTTGLRLKQIFLQILERRTVTPESDGIERMNQMCHFIYPAKNNMMTLPQRPLTQNWQGSCDYQIPHDDKVAHSTQCYPNFRVSHVLLVSLLVSLPDKASKTRYTTRTISFQTQIDLLNSHVSQFGEKECLKLPSYDCPISIEELEKLNRHGLGMEYPPSYEESTITAMTV